MSQKITSGISIAFSKLFRTLRQITHVLRTLSPLETSNIAIVQFPVRLACLIHAASVRSEPESNSPFKKR